MDTTTVRHVMLHYFLAEKRESVVFVSVGLGALGAGAWLWERAGSLRGMAYPLAAVALIQLVVGGTVYLRTDGQVARLTQQLASAPAEYRHAETARMRTVMQSFARYKLLELVLLAAGVGLVALLRPPSVWFGVGLGLGLQAALMLALDLVAAARGIAYLRAVTELRISGA